MKKVIVFIILVSIALFITFKIKFNSEFIDNKINNEALISNKDQNKRLYYLDKYSLLEYELKSSLENQYSGTTKEIICASNIEYKSWNNLMSEVYNVLHEQLSKEDMGHIRKKQIEWINMRRLKAEENTKKVEDVTIKSIVYTVSLAQSTKDRCYELITNYIYG